MVHKIAITGGSGFVGTQLVYELAEQGHEITVIDSKLKNKHVPAILYEVDYAEFFKTNTIRYDTVIHLAAESTVAPSILSPSKYYENNVIKMKVMLDSMVRTGINNIIFSSTGNVYGDQTESPLREALSTQPINPYACTKVIGEMLIENYSKAYGINYINFRYFNAAGADPKLRCGYYRRPHTHVIPVLCRAIMTGQPFTIYGTDYKTIDGTCVRDYLHISDLARAHTYALEYLDNGGKNETFNLGGGNEKGVSVKQLCQYAFEVIGREQSIIYKMRREGDPDRLIADISKSASILKWEPYYNIREIIAHAWEWENEYENTN